MYVFQSAQCISDLHLHAQGTATVAAFERFCLHQARQADALFILGDLFDYWAGDDDLADPFHAHIVSLLRQVSEHTALFLMHGNRDFLIGPSFAQAANLTLLDDPTLVTLAGQRYVLSHGDALCTDDHAYMRFREQVRQPAWQQALLARPLAERRALAQQLKQQSDAAKQDKTMQEMDANTTTVRTFMTSQFIQHQARRLIHGHTHRPAHHRDHLAEPESAQVFDRWVLTDWDRDHATAAKRGGSLLINTQGVVATSCD